MDDLSVDRRSVVFIYGLGALGAWTLASALWSPTAAWPVLEAERALLYTTAATALVFVVGHSRVTSLLAGIAVGVTLVGCYALASRLFPGHVGGAYDTSSGYQLSAPIGYWNALGLLLSIGILLALGFALRPEPSFRIAAGAALVPLSVSLYFTFSRGAVLALVIGVVVYVVLRPRVISLCAVAALPALAVLLASRPAALTRAGQTLTSAQAEGRRLAVVLAVLTIGAAVAAWAHPRLTGRVSLSRSAGRRIAVATAVTLAVFVAVVSVRAGGPTAILAGGVDAFREEPPADVGKLDRRLLSVSGHGRADYWRVAAGMIARTPVLGEGAGGFERRWMQERSAPHHARDAHNLYLETLAELGPVGLVLLLAALAVPLAAVRAARDSSLGAAAGAAYGAFLVHAAVDWDWELPLLVLLALACGVALLVLAGGEQPASGVRLRRWPVVAALGLVMTAALVAHAGNRAVAESASALEQGEVERAETAARRAQTWEPWSHEPWQLLGEAQLAAQQDDAARQSLRQAIRSAPEEWRLWLDLAIVSRGTERHRAITRARELNPLSDEIRETGYR